MPKRKEPPLSPKEQAKRFKEAAEKIGATEEDFEMTMKKILPAARSKKVDR